MKPYEFMRFYHPMLGKFVYRHKGSGIIVDNIFKPMRSCCVVCCKEVCQAIRLEGAKIRYFTYE